MSREHTPMLDLEVLHRPTTPEEAVRLYDATPGNGLYVAGGTVLVPAGSSRLDYLIDLSHVGLDYIRREGDGPAPDLAIGAGVRIADLARNAEVAAVASGIVRDAASAVATHTVRNRATVGGNIVVSHYPTDLPAALLVLDARLEVLNGEGTREIALTEFYGNRREVHEKGDLIIEVRIPGEGRGFAAAFEKLGRLKVDIAIVNCAAALRIDGDAIAEARVAVNGTGRPPSRLREVESFLAGKPVAVSTFEEAGRVASGSVEPRSNHRASADYRRKMVGVLTKRTLLKAAGIDDR